jgi:hypothetical protein
MSELPNLPGIRRDISAANPKLYKEFMASQSAEGFGSQTDSMVDTSSDLASYFDDPVNRDMLTSALSPYPSQGEAFNDVKGRYSMKSQMSDRLSKTRSLPYSSIENVPSFVKSKKETCRFLAFFRDKSMPDEIERPTTKHSRKVEISIHTDDMSIEITEPKVSNCGLLQGKILRRHQIMKPAGAASGNAAMIYTIEDFFSGAELEIYQRVYTIVDCDNYTRAKMDREGIPFGARLPLPSDTYVPINNKAPPRTGGSHSVADLGFYEYGKKVLRFYGAWDDSTALYGDRILVRLHYFLGDDTIEVLPVRQRNNGRDNVPKFLKKTKIPLGGDRDALSQASNTILQDGEPIPTYQWKDLYVGLTIQVATFSIELMDADEFTRAFYEMKNVPLRPPIKFVPKKFEIVPRPPMSSEGLIGSVTEKDGIKLQLFAGVVTRYLAKIRGPKPEDVARRFIIQCHLEDDTIQIREPPIRNSGIKGGLFLARGKVLSAIKGPMVMPTDIFLGADVSILSHKFDVYEADEATLKYMEANDHLWPTCQVPRVLERIKEKAPMLRTAFLTTRGLSDKKVNCLELEEFLNGAGANLVKQEVTTIFRSIDVQTGRTGKIQLNTLLRLVM